ncbi:universal stress protein [Desulfotomaculum copahuensis]|uniref:Universal stress protein UspA n=1 Tax=Desulfotomaculum copahuensis TaxID=1838280 RepID=A0A1B7LH22_9FIRM|nr:universal stress protein [Desulfotomaculum copahuensis]OAT85504.1 universal stress protein UspA [Desulfotomaculum copahuensis]
MAYKKILVPVDGSSRADTAARHAAELASKMDAALVLFHVVPIMPVYTGRYGQVSDAYSLINDQLEESGKEILERTEKGIAPYQIKVETKMVRGIPAQEICQEAGDGGYDLLVMGSRGLSDIKGYLMGSVSNRVSRHAPCPVLIVR